MPLQTNKINKKALQLIIEKGWDDIMIYDFNALEELYQNWQNLMPNIHPFYAVKCNSNEKLLENLYKLRTGFDCASKKEIEAILNISNDPTKIIFANPCKYESDLKYAKTKNVSLMTFDNINELYKIRDIYPNANLILRIFALDKTARFQLSKKYGAHEEEWDELLKTAKKLKLAISGISFHIGSGAKDKNVYNEALKKARKCYDLAIKYGYDISLIDIGGGFSKHTIKSFSEVINKSIKQYFENINLKFIAEPGRYFAETIVTVFTKVFGKKRRNNTFYYYISDGIYGCFNCKLHGELIPKPNFIYIKPNKKRESHVSTIFGPSCDGEDLVLNKITMPELDIGDYISWENMGAYSIVLSADFNGINMTKPMCIYIHKDKIFSHVNILN